MFFTKAARILDNFSVPLLMGVRPSPSYGFESWAYVSWSFAKDEREPPQPDPPWLVRLKRERAAMEREDELSRLRPARAAARRSP